MKYLWLPALVLGTMPAFASAGHVHWGFSFGFGFPIFAPAPVCVAPAPTVVYAPPAVTYTAPPVTYAAPQATYAAPQDPATNAAPQVVAPPAPAPAYVAAPAPVYVAPPVVYSSPVVVGVGFGYGRPYYGWYPHGYFYRGYGGRYCYGR